MSDLQLLTLCKALHIFFQEERLSRFPDEGQRTQTELEAALLNIEFGCMGVKENLGE